MTTRRDFLKTTGALAALPLAFLGKKEAASKLVDMKYLEPVWIDTETTWNDPVGEMAIKGASVWDRMDYAEKYRFPESPWRDIKDHKMWDYYHNTIDNQTWISRRYYWSTWKGMKCPSCLTNLRECESKDSDKILGINKMLSIVINTCPHDFGGTDWRARILVLDNCLCGHPWLNTAHEDFMLWMAGETDNKREARRNYPTVSDWLVGIKEWHST